MSGSLHDVKNDVWMRAVIVSVLLLVVGGVAYGAFAVGIGSVKQNDWDAAHDDLEEAKMQWDNLNVTQDDGTEEGIKDLNQKKEDAKVAWEEAHEADIDAHLSYLTWVTAGKTILVMMIVYAAFYGIAGFYNSIQPEEEHDEHHHDDDHEEHHGSASPILMATGILLFMMGFPGFVNTCKSLLGLDYQAEMGDFGLSVAGAAILIIGIGNWWNEDLKGHHEQIATSDPFKGQDIRKAGMWIFLISETMVFASFFSSYLRMRTGWCTQWAVDAGKCDVVDTTTASDLLRHEVGTLLPGAINTFALIISSYTIVLALKTAKNVDWEPSKNAIMAKIFPTRKQAVRNYLIITLALGSLFIVLKLVEWSHLIAEGFTIDTQAGSIFYVATGAHGLHVFIGLLVMLFMIFKADVLEDGYDEHNGQGIEYFGLYWHFVDLAWVAIFPAFYLY
ncbi:MAG: heme-copper oxidase subunit III [Candidatus Poseidoniaceae archaeon]